MYNASSLSLRYILCYNDSMFPYYGYGNSLFINPNYWLRCKHIKFYGCIQTNVYESYNENCVIYICTLYRTLEKLKLI